MHDLVEYMEKAFKEFFLIINPWATQWQWENFPWKGFPYIEVSHILRYKPIHIAFVTSLLQNFLKVIIFLYVENIFLFNFKQLEKIWDARSTTKGIHMAFLQMNAKKNARKEVHLMDNALRKMDVLVLTPKKNKS